MKQLLSILMLVLLPLTALADDVPLADPAQEARARVLMKEIRCLVCQNQSIEDSNAGLAIDLRNIVREHIAAGETPDQVKAYLVDRYGDWVLLKPPVRSDTMFLWLSPVLILVAIILLVVLQRKKKAVPDALTDEEQSRLEKILKEDSE